MCIKRTIVSKPPNETLLDKSKLGIVDVIACFFNIFGVFVERNRKIWFGFSAECIVYTIHFWLQFLSGEKSLFT